MMTDPQQEHVTVEGLYDFIQNAEPLTTAERKYHEQVRRALITWLRAEDERLGRRQTIPRKER